MWRRSGQGELYAYLPPNHPNTDYTLVTVPPYSAQNSDYGFSVGRGSWTFTAGSWNTLTQYVKLNEPGSENGAIQVWWNGNLVIDAEDIAIRDFTDSTFTGVHFQTFFGGTSVFLVSLDELRLDMVLGTNRIMTGSSESWNSPQDQRAYFADISGAIIS